MIKSYGILLSKSSLLIKHKLLIIFLLYIHKNIKNPEVVCQFFQSRCQDQNLEEKYLYEKNYLDIDLTEHIIGLLVNMNLFVFM